MAKRKNSSKSATPNATPPKQGKKAATPKACTKTPQKNPAASTPSSTTSTPRQSKRLLKQSPEVVTPKAKARCPRTPKKLTLPPAPPTVEEFGDPIVKSPLDTHGYKMVRLAENGFKGLLISTCLHPLDLDTEGTKKSNKAESATSCAFRKIEEFNQAHGNFKTKTGSEEDSKGKSTNVNFAKASKEQEKKTNAKRKNPAKGKVKCQQGVRNKDDNIEDFCNNNCVVVLFIRAGFFQDPKDIPGMAHFCEHVVTLGSENFPEVEALMKFVESEGGECSAGTDYEWTILFFYIDHEQIGHALEILADIFTNPKFPENYIQKEIDNVNSEYEGKRLRDAYRRVALFQSCFIDNHPASNFGLGTRETLTNKEKHKPDETMARLKDWMCRYYCMENMLFGIQGPKNLPELEQLFSKYFSKVPKRFGNFPGSSCPGPAVDQCLSSSGPNGPPINWVKWNRLYHLVPSDDSNYMTVSWALDPKFGKNFETKPISYFGHILCRKGEGSLDWFLRERGWITTLSVNHPEIPFYTTDFYTIFSIYMELTSEGLQQRIKILQVVFFYIKLLQQHKACPVIFDEVRQLHADIFHYRSDNNLSDPTIGRKFEQCSSYETMIDLLATISKSGTPSRVLLDTYLVTKYDPDVLNEFADSLKPSQSMVVFASPIFDKDATERERWYHARYYTRPMCHQLIADIEQKAPPADLRFPGPNPFVSVSLCYPDGKSKNVKIEGKSELLSYESEKGRVLYGNAKCQKGLLSTAHYTIGFASPVLEDLMDLTNAPSVTVLILVLHYILEVELGMALSSLISFQLDLVEPCLFNVSLYGPSAKLPQLGKIVLDTVRNLGGLLKDKGKLVRDLIKIQAGHYKNLIGSSEDCANQLLIYILSHKAFFLSDFVRLLEISYDQDDFLSFVTDFNSRLYIDSDLNGCVTKVQASEFSAHLQAIQITPYKRKEEYSVFQNAIHLPEGERCLLVYAKNKEDRNVFVTNYYQVGKVNPLEKTIMNAIFYFLIETAFEELRTKQNLGYFQEVDLIKIGGVPGIKISVQGAADNHTSGYINERIDAYLFNMYQRCFSSPKAFKDNLFVYSEEKQPFTMAQARNFFIDHFFPNGSHFRKLSVQMKGYKKSSRSQPTPPTKVPEKMEKYSSGQKFVPCGSKGLCGISPYSRCLELCLKGVEDENGYFITDVHMFKMDLPCFGNLENDENDDEDFDE